MYCFIAFGKLKKQENKPNQNVQKYMEVKEIECDFIDKKEILYQYIPYPNKDEMFFKVFSKISKRDHGHFIKSALEAINKKG